ncbi:MAG: methionine adenosyltransferase domain-containing protein, partial [Elusimicrobiota bacterium]
RSAAYMTRYVAKNVGAAGLAQRATVSVAYAIGIAEPVSVYIDFHGTALTSADENATAAAIRKVFNLTPKGIIETLKLRRPIYKATAAYGHFGRSEFAWEQTDKVQELRSALNIKNPAKAVRELATA